MSRHDRCVIATFTPDGQLVTDWTIYSVARQLTAKGWYIVALDPEDERDTSEAIEAVRLGEVLRWTRLIRRRM